MSQEIWKEVPEYPMYEVSSLGRVRSWKKANGKYRPYIRAKTPKLRKLFVNPSGYCVVALCKEGIIKLFRVHTLVLFTFIGERPKGMEAAHLNGKKKDNRLDNLAWVTHKENSRHKKWHGTLLFGEKHNMVKLTEAEVRSIREEYIPGVFGMYRLGKKYAVSASLIRKIIKKELWTHVK